MNGIQRWNENEEVLYVIAVISSITRMFVLFITTRTEIGVDAGGRG
jgi:hypothetical protein